jgi:hypothetical protein
MRKMLRLMVWGLLLSGSLSCEKLYAQDSNDFLNYSTSFVKETIESLTKCSFSDSYTANLWRAREEQIYYPPKFVQAHENPSKDIVHLIITMPLKGDALVKVLNAKEEICMFSMIELNGNFHTEYELDVSDWQSGAYVVQVEKNGLVSSNKIFVDSRY